MAMEVVPGHGLILPAKPTSRDDGVAQLRTELVARNVDRLVIDQACRDARIEEVWWSPTAGFVHDCAAHRAEQPGACFPDIQRVSMVLGLPHGLGVTGSETVKGARAVR